MPSSRALRWLRCQAYAQVKGANPQQLRGHSQGARVGQPECDRVDAFAGRGPLRGRQRLMMKARSNDLLRLDNWRQLSVAAIFLRYGRATC